jgi:hypothetical protein
MGRDRKLVTSAGEHFVCSVLAQFGWAASLTREGLERTDILAAHTESRRMIEVQVKAISAGSRPSWPLGKKGTISAETEREWFVLVLPRDHVAAATWIGHLSWLTSPDVPAGKRNAGIDAARIGINDWLGYEERWDLLEGSAFEAPVLLPAWMKSMANEPRVGLPQGHRWLGGTPEWSEA